MEGRHVNVVSARVSVWAWLAAAGAGLIALGGCEMPECAVAACDIRSPACQRAALRAARCVRDDEPDDLEVDIDVDVVDADRYLDMRADEAMAAAQDDQFDRSQWYEGLGLLRLMSGPLDVGEAARRYAADTAATYSSDDKRVRVLDRGEPMDGPQMRFLLVHELAHALQDARYDLGSYSVDSLDESLALAAVMEGDATLTTDRVITASYGFQAEDVDWDHALSAFEGMSLERVVSSDDPYLRLRSAFAYAYGASLVHAARERTGGLNRLFENPPRSTRAVMTGPFGDGSGDGQRPPLCFWDATDDRLSERFHDGTCDRLGSFGLWVFLQRFGVQPELESERGRHAILGLRGDALSVAVAPEDDGLLVMWQLDFDSPATLDSFMREAHAALRDGGLRVFAEDRSAWVMAAKPDDLAPDDLDDLLGPPNPYAPCSATASDEPSACRRGLECRDARVGGLGTEFGRCGSDGRGCLCAPPCRTAQDCPPKPGSRLPEACHEGHCYLDCSQRECPEGMTCVRGFLSGVAPELETPVCEYAVADDAAADM